jgi:hypothetical protein
MGGSFSREKLILIFVARHTQQRQKIKLHHFLSFLSLSLSATPFKIKRRRKSYCDEVDWILRVKEIDLCAGRLSSKFIVVISAL